MHWLAEQSKALKKLWKEVAVEIISTCGILFNKLTYGESPPYDYCTDLFLGQQDNSYVNDIQTDITQLPGIILAQVIYAKNCPTTFYCIFQLVWVPIPLLISTGFLKYPFRHSFQTGIKIQLWNNWKKISVLTDFFFQF